MKTAPCQALISLYLSLHRKRTDFGGMLRERLSACKDKVTSVRSDASIGTLRIKRLPHIFILGYCLATKPSMKSVFVVPFAGMTLLFYQAGLTPSRESRQPGGTNHPLPIAALHKLCLLLHLLIYSQRQRVDVLFNYIKDMKKFAVLQKVGAFNATVVREFDNREDAEQFRALLCRSEENERIIYATIENLSYRDPNTACAACSDSIA